MRHQSWGGLVPQGRARPGISGLGNLEDAARVLLGGPRAAVPGGLDAPSGDENNPHNLTSVRRNGGSGCATS